MRAWKEAREQEFAVQFAELQAREKRIEEARANLREEVIHAEMHLARQIKEMQRAKRSASYRHKKNLEQELILQHKEENLKLRQQQMSELPDLSYCKFGRKEG